MKDAIFKWAKLGLEHFKAILTILAFLGIGGFGGYNAIANSSKEEMLEAEKGATKIYADIASQCQTSPPKTVNFHSLMNDHLRKYH